MNYLAVGALSLILTFLLWRWRRFYLIRSFDIYMDIQASILLPEETTKGYIHASLNLQLNQYDSQLKSIYVTNLKFKNKGIHINYLNGLLFEVNRCDKKDLKLLSVGIRLSKNTESTFRELNEHVYITGKLYFKDNATKIFRKAIPIRIIR